jgi:predicted deacylase
LRQLHDGQISLISGSITCIPYANFHAYRQGVRYIQHNLNRIFDDARLDDGSDEYQTAQYIKSHIREADFILDLHTYHSGTGAFVFDDFEDEVTNRITKHLPMDQVILGWTELYADETDSGMDTIGYARSQGLT